MNTLIVFCTTYGTTEEAAKRLSEMLAGNVKLVNLMKEKDISLEWADRVILGTSVYMGQPPKQLKAFIKSHESELLNKSLGLYLCSGVVADYEKNLENAYTQPLIQHAEKCSYFGGALKPEKMRFMHKNITKIMVKASEKDGIPLPKLEVSAIEKFARYFIEKGY